MNVIPRAILRFVFIAVKTSQFIITRCVIYISRFIFLKWRKKRFTIKLVTWNFLFFDFELETRNWTNKSLTIELVAQMQVNKNLTIELVTRRGFFLFFKFELVCRKWDNKSLTIRTVTRSENFCFKLELVTPKLRNKGLTKVLKK